MPNLFYWIDTQKDVVGVTLMQYLPFFAPEGVELFTVFETEIYKAAQRPKGQGFSRIAH